MKVLKVRDVKTPVRGHATDAGIDFFVPEDFDQIVPAHTDVLIPSGIKAELPKGYMLMAANKSGVVTSRTASIECRGKAKDDAFDSSLILGACIVDEPYQGEIHIHMINTGKFQVHIKPGMKIAQFILVPVSYEDVEVVESEDDIFKTKSDRGDGGFGSTNK